MPIDDLRTRTPAARPADEADEAHDIDDDLEDIDHGGEPNPTPEQLAEIEAAWIAEAQEAMKALDEGHEVAIPWEEARVLIFAPLTPEELAAVAPRRARR
ncbi:MAG TPA: hypothetical protein VGB85_12120 [Nannocystis sp.]|jgi:hypothetical protein